MSDRAHFHFGFAIEFVSVICIMNRSVSRPCQPGDFIPAD